MALVYKTLTITTVTPNISVNFISFGGVGSAEELILKDPLFPIDIAYLEEVDTNGTGATLKDKMATYILPNGANALEQYGDSIRAFTVWGELYINKACV